MRRFICVLILFSLLASSLRQAAAEVRLASVFGDHIVLQREQPVQIWGWADKSQKVRVEFCGQAVETSAADNGDWAVTLKSLEATTEGQRLRVDSGDQSVIINDVLVGDVWHASGQSNIAMVVFRVLPLTHVDPFDPRP